MAELAARIQAAVIKGTADEQMVVYHKEWAPSRKPDLATTPTPAQHRERVRFHLQGKPPPPDVEPAGYPAWFWSWCAWYGGSHRDPDERPAGAPAEIPGWAWEGFGEVDQVAELYGTTAGERNWIQWYLDGQQGERPTVPQTIPDRWWDDCRWVEQQRRL